MSAEVNSPAFWEEVYQGGRAGWDLGGPTPVFQRLLQMRGIPPGRMIVPGAGRGHDARLFARSGFQVTAVDFADDAVRDMQALSTPDAPVKILQGDLFALPPDLDGAFDYLLEYTCFCAIDPARRPDYADLVTRLLKPGGTYIALLFPLWDHPGGPPFAVAPEELERLLTERSFTIVHHETPLDSVPQRRGLEELIIYRKSLSRIPEN